MFVVLQAIVSPSPVKEPSEEQDISEWINFDAETPENCIFLN